MSEIKVLDNNLLAQLWQKNLDNFMPRNGVPSTWLANEYQKILNLFNKDSAGYGKINSNNGNLETDSNVRHSEYIIIEPNTQYINNMVGSWSGYFGLAFYTSDGTYISGYNSNQGGYTNFTTPANAKYVRISYYVESGSAYITNEDTLMLVKGNTLPNSYIPHYAPAHFTNEEGTLLTEEYYKTLNLFNGNETSVRASNVSHYVDGSTLGFSNISGSDPYHYSTFNSFIPGKQYTIGIASTDTLQNWSLEQGAVTLNQNETYTFTATKTSYEIGFEFAPNSYSTCIIKIMLNEGPTLLPYVDYAGGPIAHEGNTMGKLLWMNANTNTSFGSISINLSNNRTNFKYIIVGFLTKSGAVGNQYVRYDKFDSDSNIILEMGIAEYDSGITMKFRSRPLYKDGPTKYLSEHCYNNNGSYSDDYLIPYQIWGTNV